MTKHFLRTLATFMAMIALGLVGVYLVNNYGQEEAPQANTGESVDAEVLPE